MEANISTEILRWLKMRLAQYKLPRRIVFLDELPRTGSGKILKRLLRKNSDERE